MSPSFRPTALTVTALLLLAGCSSVSAPEAPTVSVTPTATRVITVDARSLSFQPSMIRLQKGEKVALKITASDEDHGFLSPDLGIGFEMIPSGESYTVEIPTDATGTFRFLCGPMHPEMEGTIEVV